LPRKKAIAGFYVIVLIIGLSFLIPDTRKSQLAATIILGAGRLLGSKFISIQLLLIQW
jgi:hypothetical protein